MRRRSIICAGAIALAGCGFWLTPSAVRGADSVCYGRPEKGRLEGGVALPLKGANFQAYGALATLLDRNYVHSQVAEIVSEAYAALSRAKPELVFVYGESGHAAGGPFAPHRTHQNGLSVDFMVPLKDAAEMSVPLPTSVWNQYGYGIEFDRAARFGSYRIDFDAIALHLKALRLSAQKRGVRIGRVIFDPDYHSRLFGTPEGAGLASQIVFMKTQAWIRHDEHYHVDFVIACRPFR